MIHYREYYLITSLSSSIKFYFILVKSEQSSASSLNKLSMIVAGINTTQTASMNNGTSPKTTQ